MKKVILVQNGEKKKLKELFCVSYPTVRRALRGEADTPLITQIRQAAIERGGAEVERSEKKAKK